VLQDIEAAPEEQAARGQAKGEPIVDVVRAGA